MPYVFCFLVKPLTISLTHYRSSTKRNKTIDHPLNEERRGIDLTPNVERGEKRRMC